MSYTMLKFLIQYFLAKSRAVDTITKLKFCLSGRGERRVHYRRSLPCGYETHMLSALKCILSGQRAYSLLTDLKSHIFITASEHSVTCGYGNNTISIGLKSRISITVGDRSISCVSAKGRTKTQNI